MPIPPAVPAAAFPEARRGNAWDDWEEAYTRDEQPQADNVRLWQQANTFRPTYSILPSASNATRLPPAAALSAATTNGPPVLKILKRPTAASTGTPGSASRSASSEGRPRTEKTLAEREKEYLEARRRIYGEDSAGGELQTGMAKMSLGASAGSGKGSNSINTGARSGATVPSAAAVAGRAPRPNSRRGGSRSPVTSVPNSASNSSTDLPSSASAKQGAARQPKGPNAQSGGFGFAGASSSNPSSRSSSRGSRRTK